MMSNIEIGVEVENFYKLDDKRYVLEKNKNFLKDYREMLKSSESSFILNLEQMQKLIDSMVLFFEFKYPDAMLCDTDYSVNLDSDFMQCKSISKGLDIGQFKYRLPRKYVQFLECSYENYLLLYGSLDDSFDLSLMELEVNPDGSLKKCQLEELVQEKFLSDVNGVKTLEDLVLRFHKRETDVEYSELENWIKVIQKRISLRNQILELVPFAMLYSINTSPKNGYKRAKSFMRMFQQEYGLNFEFVESELNEIMMQDYTKKSNFSRRLKKK